MYFGFYTIRPSTTSSVEWFRVKIKRSKRSNENSEHRNSRNFKQIVRHSSIKVIYAQIRGACFVSTFAKIIFMMFAIRRGISLSIDRTTNSVIYWANIIWYLHVTTNTDVRSATRNAYEFMVFFNNREIAMSIFFQSELLKLSLSLM